jgi:5S rRNA maturation endonuclease (ribonuclease M5)
MLSSEKPVKNKMNLRKLDQLFDTIAKLKDLSHELPIIVEGLRDERSLRRIGVEGEILRVQTSHSVWELCESIAKENKEVILFTDLDSAGQKIGRLVKKYLTDKGVKVNDNIGKKLMRLLDTAEAENVSKRFEKAKRKFNYP